MVTSGKQRSGGEGFFGEIPGGDTGPRPISKTERAQNHVTPSLATDAKNPSTSPLFATLPKTRDFKSFTCHTFSNFQSPVPFRNATVDPSLPPCGAALPHLEEFFISLDNALSPAPG
jgi:hypothetical protein